MNERDYDPRYLAYFECFNRQRFFEAHEVLEGLWLPQRQAPNGLFYKGLIQLAGAFVHARKNRAGPTAALLELARTNLSKYPANHEGLNVSGILTFIAEWLNQLNSPDPPASLIVSLQALQLRLEVPGRVNDGAERLIKREFA